jgi:hypothetical protein
MFDPYLPSAVEVFMAQYVLSQLSTRAALLLKDRITSVQFRRRNGTAVLALKPEDDASKYETCRRLLTFQAQAIQYGAPQGLNNCTSYRPNCSHLKSDDKRRLQLGQRHQVATALKPTEATRIQQAES